MVDRIISYQIAHVPTYLGIRKISNFCTLIIIPVRYNLLYEFVPFVCVPMFITKMDVVGHFHVLSDHFALLLPLS
jgi:hypothetical protein